MYKFENDVDGMLSYEDDYEITEQMDSILNDVIGTLELQNHGYAHSDVREILDELPRTEGIGKFSI